MALGKRPIEIVNEGKHQLLVKAEHWERVLLGDIAKVQNGFAFSSSNFSKNKGLPLIRIRDINKNCTEDKYDGEFDEEYLVRKGNILIGMDGDFNVALWKGSEGLLNQRVCRIILTSKEYNEKFLFLCLQPYLSAINSETSSVTVKHLSSRTIEEIPLPLPPLFEQELLVSKIEELFSELDNGVESLKTAQQQLKVYRQAVLKWAFEGKLTEFWREQHQNNTIVNLIELVKGKQVKNIPEGAKPKRNMLLEESKHLELPDLPVGWNWMKLSDVAGRIFDGPFGSNLKTNDYIECGIRVIRLENIGVLEFKDNYKTYISEEKYQSIKKHTIHNGDIVFSSFIAENIRVCIIPEFIDYAINKADCFCIRPLSEVISNKFLCYFLSTRAFYSQLVNEVHGATRPRINTNQLKNGYIPLCSLEEQTQIVQEIESRLSVCDKIEETIEQSLKQAEALRQSILKKAFEGKLI